MHISAKGLDLIKSEEGLAKLGSDGLVYPYLDHVGYPTIGYGSRFYMDGTEVTMKDRPITKAIAEELLLNSVKKYEDAVNNGIVKPVTQNQFDALVSLVYNIGIGGFNASTVLRLVKANPSDEGIRGAFLMWNKVMVNGALQDDVGLTGRRKREADLYFKKD